jgi:asparagine synthase (glutamine-hydrolysing)
MCGLAGFLGSGPVWRGEAASPALTAMTGALRHRGPDADGHWLDRDARVALGHRRLSIVDLSAAGAQPMQSHDGRYVIAFNGEIYNFQALRRQLAERQGPLPWRGHSDTEVLLELIANLGVEAALTHLDGMFALAVYDRGDRILTLARDPFGEKPLYYGLWHGVVLFASELGALRAFPGFRPAIDHQATADYFKYSYIPAPRTIYEDIKKLPPGALVRLCAVNLESAALPEPRPYWDMVGTALAARADPFQGNPEEVLGAVDRALKESVSRRMVADVPLGALLSGGIDSSLVTALMQVSSTRPVRTFSIGMAEPGYNESPYARAVSDILGTDHTDLVLTPAEVQATIPHITAIYDEPFADSSQVPTFLVSRMARASVTVALSGDGGDEIFGGYNRYFHATRLWRRLAAIPHPLRRAGAALAGALPMRAVDSAMRLVGPLASRELAAGRAAEKIQKLARLLAATTEPAFHDRLLATADDVAAALTLDIPPAVLAAEGDARAASLSFTERAMLMDTGQYLPGDVLTKVDRASMAVSLEIRTPFLSRDLFQLAWSLPLHFKLGDRDGKRVIRNLLSRHVPPHLVDRPKAGFAIPIGRWLRGGLRDWAESGLAPDRLRDTGVLDVGEVRRRWQEHLTGRRDHETFLWSVLIYQGWQDAFLTGSSPSPAQAAA